MEKPTRSFLPPNLHGIFFDIAIFFVNLFLIRLLSSRFLGLISNAAQEERPAMIGLWALAAAIVLLRFTGLYFKRRPLQARLGSKTENSRLGCFGFLNLALMVVSLGVVMAPLMGYIEKTMGKQSAQVIVIPLAFFGVFVLFFEWWLFIKALTPLKEKELALQKESWLFSRKIENFADFGLFAYMILWQVIYNSVLIELFTEPVPGGFSSRIISLVFFTLGFAACYLAPRALFLVEDARYRATWLTMGMAFLPSVVRILLNL
jgi:hypothetical protein